MSKTPRGQLYAISRVLSIITDGISYTNGLNEVGVTGLNYWMKLAGGDGELVARVIMELDNKRFNDKYPWIVMHRLHGIMNEVMSLYKAPEVRMEMDEVSDLDLGETYGSHKKRSRTSSDSESTETALSVKEYQAERVLMGLGDEGLEEELGNVNPPVTSSAWEGNGFGDGFGNGLGAGDALAVITDVVVETGKKRGRPRKTQVVGTTEVKPLIGTSSSKADLGCPTPGGNSDLRFIRAHELKISQMKPGDCLRVRSGNVEFYYHLESGRVLIEFRGVKYHVPRALTKNHAAKPGENPVVENRIYELSVRDRAIKALRQEPKTLEEHVDRASEMFLCLTPSVAQTMSPTVSDYFRNAVTNFKYTGVEIYYLNDKPMKTIPPTEFMQVFKMISQAKTDKDKADDERPLLKNYWKY